MSPTLNDGDYILIKKPRSLRVGLIFVINHPRLGRIVKRLKHQSPGDLKFTGDNPVSSSTEEIGSLSEETLRGQAVLAITPKGLKRL